ncbi:hypothetical protein IAQ67_15830 [Paenibacillus peoriae]|uniref:Uncharacterized protein n=1 Tax=Paenibacillus peoriae TaxID=59893 RepID=A0A7H0Y2Q6_9BACL|nr:hypothetical protein [Paenibacillus peoriae]QNR65364.1 hypothetical protein IAQ67_15830 [Paenibacillus peoriae]
MGKIKKMATDYVKKLLRSSEYIGLISDRDGVDADFYVYNNEIAILIRPNTTLVATIYSIDRDNRQSIGFRDKVIDLYKKELRKTHRLEFARRRKSEILEAKNEAEIAALKFKRITTRSENVKKECNNKIAKLQNEIWNYKKEIKDLQTQKRNIAFAIATNNF